MSVFVAACRTGSDGGLNRGPGRDGAGQGGAGEVVCDNPCDCPQSAEPSAVQTELLFVIDASETMRFSFDPECFGSGLPESCVTGERWFALENSLKQLKPTIDTLKLPTAVMTFPLASGRFQECGVPDAPQVPAGGTFDDALAHIASFGPHVLDTSSYDRGQGLFLGKTPLNSALERAVDYLKSRPDGTDATMLIGSDGLPTCNESIGQVVSTLSEARALGFDAAVLGMAINRPESIDGLNQIALAGGLARPGDQAFFGANDASSVAVMLRRAFEEAIYCRRSVPSADGEDSQIYHVEVGGEAIPRNATDGWDYVKGESSIRLYGDACDMVLGNTELEVTLARRSSSCGSVPLE